MGRQKGSYLHRQGEFLHNYYKFVSLYNSDHAGVVRIFVALSCELGGFFNCIILRGTIFPLPGVFCACSSGDIGASAY